MLRFLLSALSVLVLGCGANAITISDNLANAAASTEFIGGDTWIAAEFVTNNFTYSLDSITLLLSNRAPGTAELDVYNSVALKPGTSVGSLVSPGSFTSSLSQTIFGGNNITLQANSVYWAVLKAPSGSFNWAWTESNTGSGVGFRRVFAATDDAGAAWFTSNGEPQLARILAIPLVSIVPEPSLLSLLAFLVLPGLVLLVRGREGIGIAG
jgi:hypothetical protein